MGAMILWERLRMSNDEHCWGNHQRFFKDGKCELDKYFCEDSPKCYLVAMVKYNSLNGKKKNGV